MFIINGVHSYTLYTLIQSYKMDLGTFVYHTLNGVFRIMFHKPIHIFN